MKIKQNYIYIIYIGAAVLVMAGVGFAGYELFKPKNTQTASAQSGQNSPGNFGGGSGQRANRGSFKPTTGTIASISDQTLTITLSDNSTKKIDCSNTSRFSKNDNGTMSQISFSDLKNGDKVNVIGTDNNGTIAARMVFVGDMPTRGAGGFNRGQYQQQDQNSQGTQSS